MNCGNYEEENQMSRGEKISDFKQYYNVENARKCLRNADRLLIDALKTSLPTNVALLEISTEELSKGLVLILNIHDKQKKIDFKMLLKSPLSDDFSQQFSELPETMKSIKNPNLYNHREKINVIKGLFDFALKNYEILYNIVNIEQVIKIISNRKNLENDNMLMKQEDFTQTIKSLRIGEWEKVKQQAMYVDFEGGIAIAPEERDLEVYFGDILKIFIIFRIILVLYISQYEEKGIDDILSDLKTILGPIYDIMKANNESGSS